MPYFEIPCHFPARALVREFRCDKIPCQRTAPPIAIQLIRNGLLSVTGAVLRLGSDFFPEFSRAAGNFVASSNIGARAGPEHSRTREPRMWRALGLMSGTSLDGIDVAMIETDGEERVVTGPSLTLPYPEAFRDRLRSVLGGAGPVAAVEDELTRLHARGVEQFLAHHPGTANRCHRVPRPHDPASPGRAPQLAVGRRRAVGAPSRVRRGRRFPLRRCRRRRRGGAARPAVPRRSRCGVAETARGPQHRRRRQCHLDRRGG